MVVDTHTKNEYKKILWYVEYCEIAYLAVDEWGFFVVFFICFWGGLSFMSIARYVRCHL